MTFPLSLPLTLRLCAAILSALLITACGGQSLVIPPRPSPPVLCLEQIEPDPTDPSRPADRDLPQPPEHGDCSGRPETFNACIEEKARDHLRAANRAEEAYDLERERRWACVEFLEGATL